MEPLSCSGCQNLLSLSGSVHLTTALSYELFLDYKRPVLHSRKHVEEVITGEGCQEKLEESSGGRYSGAIAKRVPVSLGMFANRSSFPAPWCTSPQSLGTWQPCPGTPLTARDTAHTQQLLPAKGTEHEPGFICIGTGKGKETKNQHSFFKRRLIAT